MELIAIKTRSKELMEELTGLWERSVEATHDFLKEGDQARLVPYVKEGLQQVEYLIVGKEGERIIGFMGIEEKNLEMLFLHPDYIGRGYGRLFVTYGFSEYEMNEVTVNEENQGALAFYQSMGFVVYDRTDGDEFGFDYPLLYMKRPLKAK